MSHNDYTLLKKGDRRIFLKLQRDEITGNQLYFRMSKRIKDTNNSKILRKIAEEEKKHYNALKNFTKKEVAPRKLELFFYSFIAWIFGITFSIKLLENGERGAQNRYKSLLKAYPALLPIIEDEEKHERELIELIDEERLKYIGSIVLGLNDALVELTGALAGFTFALSSGKLVAITGLITGISASLSMGASEYLSNKSEGNKDAFKSSLYTGTTYFLTVILLILPFFLISSVFISLGVTMSIAILIIAFFNYYIAVTKDQNFWKKFLEMAFISLGVAIISFGIGYIIDHFILS